MSPDELVQAWKDLEHRSRGLAAHPAGEIALDHAGGSDPVGTYSALCCTMDAVWCPLQSYYVLQCPILQ